MARKLAASLLVSTLIACVGCHVEMQAGTKAPEPTPPATPAAPAATPTPTPAATPTPAPAAVVKQEGNKLKIPGAIVFETGKSIIKPESEPVLDQLKLFLDDKKHLTLIRIEGHTDNVGDAKSNLKLSGDRALAVKDWLTKKGIDPKRLIAVGFGDTVPVADNSKEEGRSQNRRTEFVIVETNGKPWLGATPEGKGGTVFGENPRAK